MGYIMQARTLAKPPGKKKPSLPAGKPQAVKRRTISEEFIEPEKSQTIEDSEEIQDGPLMYQESTDLRNYSGYGAELNKYLADNGAEGQSYTATLYKYNPRVKNEQSVIDEFEGSMLSVKELGMEYGSGKYRWFVHFPSDSGLKPKAFIVVIDPIWDRKRIEAGIIDPRMNVMRSPEPSPFAAGMDMFKMMMDMIRPIIESSKVNQVPAFNPQQMLMENFNMTQSILEGTLQKNSALYRDFVKIAAESAATSPIDDEDDDEVKKPDYVGMLLPIIDKFLPLVLGDKTPLAQTAIQALKTSQEFKQLTKGENSGDLKHVLSALDDHFSEGGKNGKAVTEELLKRIGVKRPR